MTACRELIIDGSNLDSAGYELAISAHMEATNCFIAFTQLVSHEIQRLGFTHWSYVRLDVPFSFSSPTGSFHKEYHKYDLMYQHLKNSSEPLYLSTVSDWIETMPLCVELMRKNKQLIQQYSDQGFYEFVGTPIYDEQKTYAVFSVASHKMQSKEFRKKALSCNKKLQSIAIAFDSVGTDKYPGNILGEKMRYENIVSGRPMKLLEVMAKDDLCIQQAADKLDMTRTAADKQLAKVRDTLGVSTTHGALLVAIQRELITV